jgi:hypothetical protein
MTIVASSQQELNDDLAYWETVLMFKYHTLFSWFPQDKGFNRSLPLSYDYCNIGKIGGLVGGRRTQELHPEIAAQNIAMTHSRYPAMALDNGKKAARRMRAKALHNRWHKRRGIANPNCSFCPQ